MPPDTYGTMFLKPCKVISIGALLISNNNTNRNSKINKGYHVPGSLFLSHNKNSFWQCSIFLQLHDSENFFDYEGVNTTSAGVPQALSENLGMQHHAYIEWIHCICPFNSG
jgi:hypothetical protein